MRGRKAEKHLKKWARGLCSKCSGMTLGVMYIFKVAWLPWAEWAGGGARAEPWGPLGSCGSSSAADSAWAQSGDAD